MLGRAHGGLVLIALCPSGRVEFAASVTIKPVDRFIPKHPSHHLYSDGTTASGPYLTLLGQSEPELELHVIIFSVDLKYNNHNNTVNPPIFLHHDSD